MLEGGLHQLQPLCSELCCDKWVRPTVRLQITSARGQRPCHQRYALCTEGSKTRSLWSLWNSIRTPSEGRSLWNVKPLVGILPVIGYGCGPPGDEPWKRPDPHNSGKYPHSLDNTVKFEAPLGLCEPFSILQIPSVSSLRKV